MVQRFYIEYYKLEYCNKRHEVLMIQEERPSDAAAQKSNKQTITKDPRMSKMRDRYSVA